MSHYPYLAGVITADMVKQKGSGSYAADFIGWAKIMQLINEHAPGWFPEMGELAFAPDQTGYVPVRFVHAESGKQTPWFPQSIMNNRNQPVAAEKISARDITDTHRRGICSAAACFFSLGYELWAREDYAQAEPQAEPAKPAPKAAQPTQKAESTPAPDRDDLETQLVELLQTLAKGDTLKYLDDKATKWKLNKGGSRVQQMTIDQLQSCIDELRSRKDS